jgi:DNA polymerase
LRGLFVSAPGKDLVCSDYSSIEAVVLAELAGEEWRREVFRTHGRIYEMSAAKITGVPMTEARHPQRQLGKVAELAGGYQGWIGAWKAFGADKFLTDDEIKTAILAWRAASPTIPELWGGQPDWRRPEYWGIEGCAVQAVLAPGTWHSYRGLHWIVRDDCLCLVLLSGRTIYYQRPRLEPSTRREGTWSLSYEGYNTNPKNGPMGWIRIETWGGRLVENIVQATANDILRYATVNAEARGYSIVLHVYDELIAEVETGSVAELESIMMETPAWCRDWPIKAAGGWKAKRYRK